MGWAATFIGVILPCLWLAAKVGLTFAVWGLVSDVRRFVRKRT